MNYIYQNSFSIGWIMFFLGGWIGILVQVGFLVNVYKTFMAGFLIITLVYILLRLTKKIRWDDDEEVRE